MSTGSDSDEFDVDAVVSTPGSAGSAHRNVVAVQDSTHPDAPSQLSPALPLTVNPAENVTDCGAPAAGTEAVELARKSIRNQVDFLIGLAAEADALRRENDELKANQRRTEDRGKRDGGEEGARLRESADSPEVQTLREKLHLAEAKILELEKKCEELRHSGSEHGTRGELDPNAGASGGIGYAAGNLMQTESLGNARQDVDPATLYINEEIRRHGDGHVTSPTAGRGRRQGADHRSSQSHKEPTPEECAVFLADRIAAGGPTNTFFRNLGLSEVDRVDIEEKYPREAKEQRIEGIKTALSKAERHKRIPFLRQALRNSGLRYQAEQFCQHFKIQDSSVLPSTDKKLPVTQLPKARNSFEKALWPHLRDPLNLPSLSNSVSMEPPLSSKELTQFPIESWTQAEKRSFVDEAKKNFVHDASSAPVLDVLNAWAAVELARVSSSDRGIPPGRVEPLARAWRVMKRSATLQKVQKHLKNGLVGPAVERKTYLREVSYTLRKQLIDQLNLPREDGKDWKALAEKMNYNNRIEHWQNKPSPAEVLWDAWKTKNTATVSALYDWAVENHRADIAEILERDTPAL